jgi:hypothetical protein
MTSVCPEILQHCLSEVDVEVIVPAFIVLVLAVFAAIIAVKLTRKWNRGVGIAVLLGFSSPILYVASILGMQHLRDEYHRQRLEAYDFDGSCDAPLGHGYRLQFFDEDPWLSQIVAGSLSTPGKLPSLNSEYRLVENRVQRLAITKTDVYGQAGATDQLDGPADHYFRINLVDGTDRRYPSEADLRQDATTNAPFVTADQAFNDQEGQQRSTLVSWIIGLAPLVFLAGCWFLLRLMGMREAPGND